MSQNKKLCVNYMKGHCKFTDNACIFFHPIKLKENFYHWTLCCDAFGSKFSLKANSIGFSHLNKNRIRREFFIILKNLLIYEKQIVELVLFLYDRDYPRIHEDPMFEEEVYDSIFKNLSYFKYLTRLEIDVGSLYPLLKCKKAFENMFITTYSLNNLCIEMQNNNDDQIWSEYDCHSFLDILIKQKQIAVLTLKINKQSKKDLLLINLLIESPAKVFIIEYTNLYKVKVTNNHNSLFCKKKISFTVMDEIIMNFDNEGILQEINKNIIKSGVNFSTNFNSFRYKYKGPNKKMLMDEFNNNFFVNLDKMIHLQEIDFTFSTNFLNDPTNFKFLIEKKLIKHTNLKKIHFNMFYDLLEEKVMLSLMKFIDNNSHSLLSLNLNKISTILKWKRLSELFENLLKMKIIVSLNIDLIDEAMVIQANFPSFSNLIRRFLKSNSYLVNFNLKARFQDSSLGNMHEDYSFFLRKRKIFILYVMALKRSSKLKCLRKEIFIEIFVKMLNGKKPIKNQLNFNAFPLVQRNQFFLELEDDEEDFGIFNEHNENLNEEEDDDEDEDEDMF